MLKPSAVVLYVDNLSVSSAFYQNLFAINPLEESPTFHSFQLSNGMGLALKAKHSVVPTYDGNGTHSELAFTLENHKKVDEIFVTWQAKEIEMLMPPTVMPYGYTFVALDPDGHRLRVISLAHS